MVSLCFCPFFAAYKIPSCLHNGCGLSDGINLLKDEEDNMLTIHKNIVLDENQKPIAVQIPIEEFRRLEEVIENYGLAQLMDEVKDDERLSVHEAKAYYNSLK